MIIGKVEKLTAKQLAALAEHYNPKRELQYKCRCGHVTTRPIYWGFPLTCVCPEPVFEFTCEAATEGEIPKAAKDVLALLGHIRILEQELGQIRDKSSA